MTEDALKTYRLLREKLQDIMPDFEIRAKAELACRINQLKGDLGAVILGHNYMEPGLFHSVPRFHRRLPGVEPTGRHHRWRSHRFLRGPLHGGNSQDPESPTKRC